MRYITAKCPNCKRFIKIMKPSNWSYEDYLGEPIAYCPFCSKPYKTGKKRWNSMSEFEKRNIKFKPYIRALLGGFLIGIILSAIIGYLFINNKCFEIYKLQIFIGVLFISYLIALKMEKTSLSMSIEKFK